MVERFNGEMTWTEPYTTDEQRIIGSMRDTIEQVLHHTQVVLPIIVVYDNELETYFMTTARVMELPEQSLNIEFDTEVVQSQDDVSAPLGQLMSRFELEVPKVLFTMVGIQRLEAQNLAWKTPDNTYVTKIGDAYVEVVTP